MSAALSGLARAVAMLVIAAFLVSPTGQKTTRVLVQNIVQFATDKLVPVLTPATSTHHTNSSTTPPKETR